MSTRRLGLSLSVLAALAVGVPAPHSATAAPATPSRLGDFHPVPKAAVLDTRSDNTPLAPGATRHVQVTNKAGIPDAHVAAVLVQLVGIRPSAPARLLAWDGQGVAPHVIGLAVPTGEVAATEDPVAVASDGTIGVQAQDASLQLRVVVLGWFSDTTGNQDEVVGAHVRPVQPVQVFDGDVPSEVPTDLMTGATNSPNSPPQDGRQAIAFESHTQLHVTVSQAAGQPAAESRVFLQARTGGSASNEADVYAASGRTTDATVLAPYKDGTTLTVLGGTVHVHVELVGLVDPYNHVPDDGQLRVGRPVRVFDTRSGTATTPGPLAGTAVWQVAGRTGVPDQHVGGVRLAVTVSRATGTPEVRLWPKGAAASTTPTIIGAPGQLRTTTVITRLGRDGQLELQVTSGSADVEVDLLGWYDESNALVLVPALTGVSQTANLSAAVLSPDGLLAYATDRDRPIIHVVDTLYGIELPPIQLTRPAIAMTLDPDGRTLSVVETITNSTQLEKVDRLLTTRTLGPDLRGQPATALLTNGRQLSAEGLERSGDGTRAAQGTVSASPVDTMVYLPDDDAWVPVVLFQPNRVTAPDFTGETYAGISNGNLTQILDLPLNGPPHLRTIAMDMACSGPALSADGTTIYQPGPASVMVRAVQPGGRAGDIMVADYCSGSAGSYNPPAVDAHHFVYVTKRGLSIVPLD